MVRASSPGTESRLTGDILKPRKGTREAVGLDRAGSGQGGPSPSC